MICCKFWWWSSYDEKDSDLHSSNW